jgi:hypothetical protein
VDFLGFLRGLFNSGQNSAAPSEQIPASIRRPAEQEGPSAPQPSFFQNAVQQVSAPPSPFAGGQAAPAPQSFQSYLAAAPQVGAQQAPAQQEAPAPSWNSQQANWMSSPLNETPALPQNVFPNGQQNYMVSPNPGAKEQVAEREQTAKTEAAQKNWFGDEGQYAAKEMSVEEYLNLAPRQRAAIDANTALVQAAEQDKSSWAKQQLAGSTAWDDDYFNQVKQSFGDAGGSDTYAPRTMAVLKDLGLNLDGKDLDQYLNYSALVTADDLKGLTPAATTAPTDDPRLQNAVAFSEAASTRLSETLAMGQNLLDGLRSAPNGGELFGTADSTPPPVGFTESPRDAELAQTFDILAQTRSQQDLTPDTLAKVYAELESKHGVTPNEVAQYFETRLQAKEYEGAATGQEVTLQAPGTSLPYLTPQDFRAKFLKRGE